MHGFQRNHSNDGGGFVWFAALVAAVAIVLVLCELSYRRGWEARGGLAPPAVRGPLE